jgi:hypothetical protein
MSQQTRYTAGFRDRLFDKDPFPLAIWYPSHAAEGPVRHMGVTSTGARDADFADDGPYPLVMFSQGTASISSGWRNILHGAVISLPPRSIMATIILIRPMRGN